MEYVANPILKFYHENTDTQNMRNWGTRNYKNGGNIYGIGNDEGAYTAGELEHE